MAHRRKSSNPLCKQKRISSVVDRVLAAKLKETEDKKIFYGDSRDSDSKTLSGNDSDGQTKNVRHERTLPDPSKNHQDRDQNIAIPEDLLGEFQALQKATKLDTANLMRKLIHDYSKTSEKKSGGSRLTSQLFDVSIKSSDKDRTGLINYYENEAPINQNETIRIQRTADTPTLKDVSLSSHMPVEVRRNPSPVRIYSAEPYYWSDEHYSSHGTDNTFANGYGSSMKVPTVIKEQNSDSNSDGQSLGSNSRPRSRQNMYSPSTGSENAIRNNTSDPNIEYSYSAESPELKQPELCIPEAPMMEDGSVASAFPLVASLCDENGVIISPKQTGETLEKDQKVDDAKFSQDIISQTDAHMAMQALNPHGITAKLHKASGKSNAKKGQMKLIAENTSNHGVYTSVLKLPWSRRTRTPKNDPGKNLDKDLKQIMQTDDHNELADAVDLEPIDIKTEPIEDIAELPKSETPVQTQLQQPVMLVPVTGIPSTQNGIFVPANSLPLTTPEAQPGAPPMMMVYPNSSFANVGRPTRKRGRPPKVPVLTRMLSDTSKIPRFDFPVTNFFPQFAPCPQPAIVLNVNNMMNTGSVGNATNNTNTNVNTKVATNTVESNINLPQEEGQQQFGGDENKSSTTAMSETISQSIPMEIFNMAEQKAKDIVPVNDDKPPELSQSAMTTTTSIANSQSGAIYQEMILSSKSLVNVRPRKRQSTTEILKSKSTPSNDFICTSFKLRNVNKPEKEKKKTPWVPGMKRRGRPPKKKIFSMMEGQADSVILNPEQFMPATIHHFPQPVVATSVQPPELFSPTVVGQHTITPQVSSNGTALITQVGEDSDTNGSSSSSDHRSSNDENKHTEDEKDDTGKDMFQQLFHCKICNEIVPVEKRDEHREKHVQIKYCCNKCECSKISYVQRNDMEKDENIDKLLKCNECKAADDNSNGSSVSLMCEQCDERFLKFSTLTNHKESAHQNTAVKDFGCSECDKAFQNIQKLKLHRQLCHQVRHHSCPYQNCQKIYISQYKLQSHIKKRHGNVLHLRCIFDGCNERFTTHSSLEDHIKSKHYSIKRYTCSKPGCDEEFTSERDLKFHLLLHNDSDLCTFECEICDYRCHQQHVLDWHMKNLHPETVLRNEQTELMKMEKND